MFVVFLLRWFFYWSTELSSPHSFGALVASVFFSATTTPTPTLTAPPLPTLFFFVLWSNSRHCCVKRCSSCDALCKVRQDSHCVFTVTNTTWNCMNVAAWSMLRWNAWASGRIRKGFAQCVSAPWTKITWHRCHYISVTFFNWHTHTTTHPHV